MDKDNTNLKEPTENEILKRQRERLKEVFKYLKFNGITQREIAEKTNRDTTALSSYLSGKIKHIPNEFLEKLREFYDIDSKYIRLESEYMKILDDKEIRENELPNMQHFVKKWDFIDGTTRNLEGQQTKEKLLHLILDKNYIDFLIDLKEKIQMESKGGVYDISDEMKERMKALKSAEHKYQEFVLVPRNIFIDIAEESAHRNKSFRELIDCSVYAAYYEE